MPISAYSDHHSWNMTQKTPVMDPANRIAVQGELSKATNLYSKSQPGFVPPLTELPRLNRWQWSASDPVLQPHPWDRRILEVPFISACLLLSVL
jgi:hypothetical protein